MLFNNCNASYIHGASGWIILHVFTRAITNKHHSLPFRAEQVKSILLNTMHKQSSIAVHGPRCQHVTCRLLQHHCASSHHSKVVKWRKKLEYSNGGV